MPCGWAALNAAEPLLDSEISAPIAFCGSSSPLRNSMKALSSSTRPATSEAYTDPGGATVAKPSATSLPLCGLPTEVIEATRSGRTEAT